tara:strand:+ start:94 stop:579 length:486 start_codon:yes stop_codon:yes gene_type:complete
MIYLKTKFKIFTYFILIMLIGCGYKPLYKSDKLNNLSFSKIEILGNKRISQLTANSLNLIKKPSGNFVLSISSEKKNEISNQNSAGKVLEYSLSLNYSIKVKKNSDGKVVYSKNIVKSANYKPSETYSDTVSNEKKIVENLSNFVAKQIVNELSLFLQDDN